jgi:hypothetical protein
MSSSDKAPSGDVREIIVQAAFDEFAVTGIDRFNFDRVSARAGVDVGVIETLWDDRRVLLMEAVLSSSENAEVLFTASPIGAAYVEQAVEIFLRGICR